MTAPRIPLLRCFDDDFDGEGTFFSLSSILVDILKCTPFFRSSRMTAFLNNNKEGRFVASQPHATESPSHA